VDAGCPASRATYPGAWAGHPQTPLYLVLHRVGFTELPGHPGNWCALTAPFHPYRWTPPCSGLHSPAVCFLLHFPSCRHDSTLWSTLPCGVRTFLRPRQGVKKPRLRSWSGVARRLAMLTYHWICSAFQSTARLGWRPDTCF